jgi:hypothetical protein
MFGGLYDEEVKSSTVSGEKDIMAALFKPLSIPSILRISKYRSPP